MDKYIVPETFKHNGLKDRISAYWEGLSTEERNQFVAYLLNLPDENYCEDLNKAWILNHRFYEVMDYNGGFTSTKLFDELQLEWIGMSYKSANTYATSEGLSIGTTAWKCVAKLKSRIYQMYSQSPADVICKAAFVLYNVTKGKLKDLLNEPEKYRKE